MNRTVRTSALAAVLLTIAVSVGGCASEPAADANPVQSPAASSQSAEPAPVGKPTRVVIPAIEVDVALEGVGLNTDGSMHIPDFGEAGWYDLGPRPGAPGPAVLVAHVNGPAGPDVFERLHELKPGDEVTVHGTDGASTFVVEGSEQVPKDELPYDRIWGSANEPVLRLITCGGKRDTQLGGYPDNTIVYAR
ncbi:MAG: sortase domain-containing protein [Aeromicrobium sp.]